MLITDVQQVTPQWLTDLFQSQGVIKHGNVTEVRVMKSGQTDESRFYYLSVQYADFRDSRSASPSLFLKIPRQGLDKADREIEFYTQIAPIALERYTHRQMPFVACYHAAYDAESVRAHVLMADVSKGYYQQKEATPPTLNHMRQMVDSLARFHAFWWEHPRLGDGIGERPTEESLEADRDLYRAKFDEMDGAMGERLFMRPRQVMQKLINGLPSRLHERLVAGRGITLIHADTQPDNFMHAHNDSVLIDWQSWRVGMATDDLAFMIACHWPREERDKLEQDTLKRYHDTLKREGVRDTSWDDLWHDYRLSIARNIGFMMADWTPDKSMGEYQRRIDRAVAAFIQLDGLDLFE